MTSAGRVKEVLATLEPLLEQLQSYEVLMLADEDYRLHVSTFSAKKDLEPAVVFVPVGTESLSKIIGFLYKSDLDFHIRGQGFNSPSSRDVLVSLLGFKSFDYDSATKLATVGVGNTWVEVADHMQGADSRYSLTVARTPSVGVGGSILHGGYSWMTSELGFISDPVNFVDAEVVKYDGTVVMAADEPDLMWALRGSGGGFGIMTRVVLQAHSYPANIWSGMILIPRDQLSGLARCIADFISRPQHPKLNFLLYMVREALLPTVLPEGQLQSVKGDMLALHAYDACGEYHGRQAFHWALNMPGAIDLTTVTNMKGVVDMQRNVAMLRGVMSHFRAVPMATTDLDEATIVRAIEWHDIIESVDRDIHNNTMLILEFLVLSDPIGGVARVAFPRPLGLKHYLLVLTGCPADGTEEQEQKVTELVLDAPKAILGSREHIILPPGIDELQDPRKSYAATWDKLVDLRRKFDPELKFKALVNPGST